jgi:hypothetical protein
VKSIALAIARDGASGGVVRTVTVSCFSPYLSTDVLICSPVVQTERWKFEYLCIM